MPGPYIYFKTGPQIKNHHGINGGSTTGIGVLCQRANWRQSAFHAASVTCIIRSFPPKFPAVLSLIFSPFYMFALPRGIGPNMLMMQQCLTKQTWHMAGSHVSRKRWTVHGSGEDRLCLYFLPRRISAPGMAYHDGVWNQTRPSRNLEIPSTIKKSR